MKIVFWIIIAILVVVSFWWWYSLVTMPNKIKSTPTALFQPMIDNFASYPHSLWFTNDRETLNNALVNNKYRYRIIESNGFVIFDNRRVGECTTLDEEIFSTMEYVQACANGQGTTLRDGTRYVAIQVTSGDTQRVVYISSPQLYI